MSSANHGGLKSHHQQMKRCDGHLPLPAAAAADTSMTPFSGEADRRLTEHERIKRAKHNGGTTKK